MSKKRRLTEDEVRRAQVMMGAKGATVASVSRHFGVTKPQFLKSLGIWNTEIKIAGQNNKYRMNRGKMEIMIEDESLNEEGGSDGTTTEGNNASATATGTIPADAVKRVAESTSTPQNAGQ